jgi:RND superfamily putative drug exporter
MPVFLARIGRFSARHRLLVVAAWLLVLLSLTGIIASQSGKDAGAPAMPSSRAGATLQTVQEKFPGLNSSSSADTLQLVMQTADGAPITGQSQRKEVADVLAAAKDVEHVTSVSNPLSTKSLFVSPDQTTAVATLTFDGLTDDNRQSVQDAVIAVADRAPATLTTDVGHQLAADGAPAAGVGEVVGVLVAFLVLFLTFGSLLVAGANMLVAIIGLAVGTLGILTYGTFSPLQDTTITLATMLGLAVGIDYSLFIISRFRTELREGRTVEDAIARATGTAGTAVVFAGLTVVIALAALSVVGISTLTAMGLAGAFAVVTAVLMALTLLPVLLRSLGRRALGRSHGTGRRTQPERNQDSGRGFFARWVGFLVRRPLVAILAAVTVLIIGALPMLDMKTASNVPGGLDPASTQRAAYTTVQDKFGGIQSPLLVLVTDDDARTAAKAVTAELSGLPGVQSVTPGPVTAAGDAALINVIPTGGPIDDSTKDLVHTIRDRADAIPGAHLEVTGETAIGIDSDADMRQALIQYIVVIVVLSFLLLTLMFRSLLVPLAATVGFLLSVGVSFGASVAVFQWGWLDALIPAPQGDPMLSLLPVILVGVLFGLAMDYQVFLVSRIHEMHGKGFSPEEAVKQGFGKSAPVLVAAATIMTVVFAGFATSPMTVAASIAFGLVAGVLADAFLVRMVIMPALLALMGRSAWWLPRWLDRALPNLDVEGHALDHAENQVTPAAEPKVPVLV